jgi:hypothetical protein
MVVLVSSSGPMVRLVVDREILILQVEEFGVELGFSSGDVQEPV